MEEDDTPKWKYGTNHFIASTTHPMTDERLSAMEFVNSAAHTRASIDHIKLASQEVIDGMDKFTHQTLYSLIKMENQKGIRSAHLFIKEYIRVLASDNKIYDGKENTYATHIVELFLERINANKSIDNMFESVTDGIATLLH